MEWVAVEGSRCRTVAMGLLRGRTAEMVCRDPFPIWRLRPADDDLEDEEGTDDGLTGPVAKRILPSF